MIPTFNRAEYLPRAVESALSQDYNDIEVIVSDNASTDNTMDVVERFKANKKFKYYRNNKNSEQKINSFVQPNEAMVKL